MTKRRTSFSSFRFFILPALAFMASAVLSVTASAAPGAQAVERKLRVKVENAQVRLKPEAGSPVVAVLKRGTVVMSYQAEGAFFRIVPDPDQGAASVVGYLAAADVEVLKEKAAVTRDFWNEESTSAGLGLELYLAGGYAMFGGGDFDTGTRGLYDETKAMMTGLGYSISSEYYHALKGGMELSAGIFWRFRPRLAVGIMGEYSLAQRFNKFEFKEGTLDLGANATPVLQTFAIRPGLRYGILIGGPVELAVTAGPTVFFSSFKYDVGVNYDFMADIGTTSEYSYYVKSNRTFLGAFAALDLDVRVNSRSAVFLRATYRYAKPSGWEGSQKTVDWTYGGFDESNEVQGRLYATDRGSFPILMMASENPGSGAGEAVLDYSGLSLSAGVRIRF